VNQRAENLNRDIPFIRAIMETARNLLTIFAYGAGASYMAVRQPLVAGPIFINWIVAGALYIAASVVAVAAAILFVDAMMERFRWSYSEKWWVRLIATTICEAFAVVPLLAFVPNAPH